MKRNYNFVRRKNSDLTEVSVNPGRKVKQVYTTFRWVNQVLPAIITAGLGYICSTNNYAPYPQPRRGLNNIFSI